MGSLTLPSNGPVYLDASEFIYSVERIQPYSDLLEPKWRQALDAAATYGWDADISEVGALGALLALNLGEESG